MIKNTPIAAKQQANMIFYLFIDIFKLHRITEEAKHSNTIKLIYNFYKILKTPLPTIVFNK